jgi:outer membrane protein OmpA-like peptidoglycan-associated protein
MKKILTLSIFLCAGNLFAQTNPMFYNFRSVAQSSFLNPAHVSRQGFTIGILDNFNHISTPGISAYDLLRSDETGNQTIEKLLNNNSYHLKDIHIQNEVNPLFLGFRIKKNYFSFAMQNTASTLLGIPKDLASLVYYGNANSTQTFNRELVLSDLQLKFQSYTSLSASYTREFGEKLTIGVRGKYHIGLADVSLERNNTTIKTDSGNENSYRVTASTDYLLRASGIARIEDLLSELESSVTGANKTAIYTQFAQNIFKKPVGSGISVDIGADYKFNKKLSMSASVLDLGSITWKEARSYSRAGTFVFEGFNTDDPSTIDSAEFAQMMDSVSTVFKPQQDTINSYTTRLNPRFYLGFNYQLFKSGSIGLVGYGETWNNKFYPGASISYTQRIWRLLDLRVNYNVFRGNNQNIGAGLALQLAPVSIYLLSDNIMGWAPTDGAIRLDGRYTTVRFGVNINIGGRFDSDNDGVPNRKDKCKKVPGLVKFDGCPDTDKDGVPDAIDECINIPGSIAANGCPDADADGVKDAIDSCINEKGKIKLNGCPDKDNDGVADKFDKCPNDSGMITRNGCPDTDGDGILDKEDACPKAAGWKGSKGCPDADRDSVPDSQDECINSSGPVKFKGCPDTDGDGIINKLDSCAMEAGPANTNGCPDTDGDGVADKYDNCPTEAGSFENAGCPNIDPNLVILNEAEKKVLNEAFSSLEFLTGTSKISESSLLSLTELANLFIAKPDYKLEINGHTDNLGNAKNNKKLSQDRANAVKAFIVSKGIATDRLKATGFGSSKAIADNKTPEGRQRNRRVEFKIVK